MSWGFDGRRALQRTQGPRASRPGFETGSGPSLGSMHSAPPSGSWISWSRRLDLHQHQPVYKTGAFLRRATSAKHEREDSNPIGRLWRPLALPGAHSHAAHPPVRRVGDSTHSDRQHVPQSLPSVTLPYASPTNLVSNPIECDWSVESGGREPGDHQRPVGRTATARFLDRQPGCPNGVEPLPSGSQPDMQKPLHHGHHPFLSLRSANELSFLLLTTRFQRKARDSNPYLDKREPP